jgi:hypothetical protein
MKLFLISVLAVSLGCALPAFAANGATSGATTSAAHSASKHKRSSATKQQKPRHRNSTGVTK